MAARLWEAFARQLRASERQPKSDLSGLQRTHFDLAGVSPRGR
jgi:hypothetical protein